MLVMWKANFSGTKEQLAKVTAKLQELAKKQGGKVDGPYYAQDADVLYLMWTKAGTIGMSGKDFLPWVTENKIPIEPASFSVALTDQEMWS